MQHLRGIAQRGLDVVRDHDDGDIVAEVDELDEIVQLPRRHGVQPGDRLVEQQQLLRGAQGAREQHALLLAAGERLIALVFQIVDSHALLILQRGGASVFTENGLKEIHENIAVYKRNAKVQMDALDELGIWYCGGKNAPYIWFRCPDGMSSWEMFDLLLNKAQIVGTPGEGFGKCGEGYFRLSMFGDPDDTKEAAKRMKELLKK